MNKVIEINQAYRTAQKACDKLTHDLKHVKYNFYVACNRSLQGLSVAVNHNEPTEQTVTAFLKINQECEITVDKIGSFEKEILEIIGHIKSVISSA